MSVAERVSAYRRRMRARGYRSVQIWLPDVRTPEFTREAHRQAGLLAQSDREGDDQDFIESISVDWGDE